MQYKVINNNTKLKADEDGIDLYCPICGAFICEKYDSLLKDHNYCYKCGQAIDNNKYSYLDSDEDE